MPSLLDIADAARRSHRPPVPSMAQEGTVTVLRTCEISELSPVSEPELPAFTLPPLPSNVAALLLAAAGGTLPVETITLRPGTTTSDPNRWVILAVTRLRYLQERDGPDYRKNGRSDAAILEGDLQTVADWWKYQQREADPSLVADDTFDNDSFAG